MAITKKKVEKNKVDSKAELFDMLDKQFDAYFTPEKYRTGILPLDEVLGGYLESGSVVELSGESGCVDADTEFFTGHGWKRIADYEEGDQVLQYNANGTAELITPIKYHKLDAEYLTEVKTKSLDMCLSDEHNVYYITSKGNLRSKTFDRVLYEYNNNVKGFRGSFINSFSYSGKGLNLTDAEIRVMVAVIADGSFPRNTNYCRMNLKKNRKKKRLVKLLTEAGISYRAVNKEDGYTVYTFYTPRREKVYTKYWYDANTYQLEVIADEIFYWDGWISKRRANYKEYLTCVKESADFIQFVLTSLGYKTSIYTHDRHDSVRVMNGKIYPRKHIEYAVHPQKYKRSYLMKGGNNLGAQITRYKTTDGFKYCFTTYSGMWVMRRNNKIVVTGNCGKSTVILHLLKNLAEMGLKSVYIDAEGSVKESMLNGIGLMPYLSTRENRDNMFTLVRESGYETVEQLISTFLKVGGYKVFVIDSLTSLTGDVYLDLDENRQSTEGRVGFDALMNSRLLKKLSALKTRYNCIFIVVNQTRIDMSNPYMASYKSTGGQAAKFYPDVRLFMKVKEKLKDKQDLLIGKGIETIIGSNCTIEAHKSRLGPGFIPYPMTIYFGKGVSNLAAYVAMLPNLKNKRGHYIFEKASNVTYRLHLDSGDVQTTKGKEGLNRLVVEHADEISKLCEAYMNNYFAQFKSNKTTSTDYDTREDLVVEENEVQDYEIDEPEDLEVE